ncbi:MAG: hypothetical protein P9L88_08035 [Candidatus Tantalella remota]|nr:hypothetical protein [Candidatus Tantalella remota]
MEEGSVHDSMREDIERKRTDITTKHIVESIHSGKEQKLFEDQMSEKFVLYKVKINKLDEMSFSKTPKICC